jgi:hypothetical protein
MCMHRIMHVEADTRSQLPDLPARQQDLEKAQAKEDGATCTTADTCSNTRFHTVQEAATLRHASNARAPGTTPHMGQATAVHGGCGALMVCRQA